MTDGRNMVVLIWKRAEDVKSPFNKLSLELVPIDFSKSGITV